MSEHARDHAEDLPDESLEAPAELEEEIDPELLERRRAALAEIRQFGDPVLKMPARPVSKFDSSLRREIEKMATLMHEAMGVGLAATQIGILSRLLVFQAGPDAPVTALANPAVEWSSEDLETASEGCLSLPGISVEVERPLYILVRGQDEEGDGVTIEASGLEARVLQHEIDHLNGVLILDRTSREERREALRKLREGTPEPSAI